MSFDRVTNWVTSGSAVSLNWNKYRILKNYRTRTTELHGRDTAQRILGGLQVNRVRLVRILSQASLSELDGVFISNVNGALNQVVNLDLLSRRQGVC
jgi:hypothetical protein